MNDSPSFESRLVLLFNRTHQRLFRLGCRMGADPDEAQDLVQEAFLRATTRPGSLPDSDAAAEAWLVRVVVNLCHDLYRKSTVRLRLADQVRENEPLQNQESEVMARSMVRTALAALSPQRRAIISLHELEGLSVREVARMLRVAEVTVRWHLAKGRKEIAAHLAQRGYKL
jgi:RNA polymerase sigma-70 factor (ECF subfamily)